MSEGIKYVLAFAIILYAVADCNADSTSCRPLNVAYRLNYGKIWVHSPKLKVIPLSPLSFHSLLLLRKASGSEAWHSAYSYPLYGLEFNLANYGNPKILGYSFGVAPHIAFPVVNYRNYRATISVSPGISYFNRVYHATNNPNNLAISSRFNALVQVGLNNEFRLTTRAWVALGLNLIHTSNATLKKPNTGLNMVAGVLQFRYACSGEAQISKPRAAIEAYNKNRIQLLLAGATKEIKEPGGNKYLVAVTSLEYLRSFTPFTSLGVSADLFYDSSSPIEANDLGIPYEKKVELAKLGVALVSEYKLNRLSMVHHLGAYGYNITKNGKNIYQRIGLRYSLSEKYSLILGLKGHMFTGGYLAIADHLELGCVFKVFGNQ